MKRMKIGLGWRRRRSDRQPPTWWSAIWARELAFRRRLAFRLQKRAARLSPAQLRWCCFFFLLMGCLTYTWILVRAVTVPAQAVDYKPITIPARAGKVAVPRIEPRASFRRYMDSIHADPVLNGRFDSLRAARPGFADTIRQLEEMYPGH
jgi:hypothetical protein